MALQWRIFRPLCGLPSSPGVALGFIFDQNKAEATPSVSHNKPCSLHLCLWNAHSGSQLIFKKSLLPYDHHVLFQANHMERLFMKRNTWPTLAVSDIPAEMPDMEWRTHLGHPPNWALRWLHPQLPFQCHHRRPQAQSNHRSAREKLS